MKTRGGTMVNYGSAKRQRGEKKERKADKAKGRQGQGPTRPRADKAKGRQRDQKLCREG